MEKYKTVIVGAGPAGLRCAKILADNNEDFILLEKKSKFDRKICAGLWGLTEKTKAMELPDELFEKKFNKMLFFTPKRKIEAELEKPFVATLNREKLSQWMFQKIKEASQKVIFNSPVSKVCKNFVVINQRKIYFDWLVGADGTNSIVRKSLGLPQRIGIAIQYWLSRKLENLEVHFNADRFGPWYLWVVPHREVASVGMGGDPLITPFKKMKENLDFWCKENKFDISGAEFETAPINYDYKGYHFGNVFLTGDAAGFASELTGEGIYSAMASAEDVAKTIINQEHSPVLIKKILSIKRKHKAFVGIFKSGKIFEKIGHNLLLDLLNSAIGKKLIIGLIC